MIPRLSRARLGGNIRFAARVLQRLFVGYSVAKRIDRRGIFRVSPGQFVVSLN